MSRVSQALASQISTKLMVKKREAEKKSKEDYREYFTEIAEKKVPKEVMAFFKKHSEYCKTTSSLYVDGKGFSRLSVSLLRAIPSVSPNCYYEHIDLTEAEATKGKKLHDAYEKLFSDNNSLEREIEQTLLSLRTYANVQKELPEATEYLPEQGLTVIVDTNGLRNKLKS